MRNFILYPVRSESVLFPNDLNWSFQTDITERFAVEHQSVSAQVTMLLLKILNSQCLAFLHKPLFYAQIFSIQSSLVRSSNETETTNWAWANHRRGYIYINMYFLCFSCLFFSFTLVTYLPAYSLIQSFLYYCDTCGFHKAGRYQKCLCVKERAVCKTELCKRHFQFFVQNSNIYIPCSITHA